MSDIGFDELKAKQRRLRAGFPDDMGLRVHRAISWVGRAEQETDDPDAAFIYLWIAFNAAYADATDPGDSAYPSERRRFRDVLEQLVCLDAERRLHRAVWTRFQGPIRQLMANRYVFQPFWRCQAGSGDDQDWDQKFVSSARRFTSALKAGDTERVLSMMFDRLYMLRNQMMHGGTTWNSRVNRSQVEDGAAILSVLLPVMIDLMLDNPHEDWGTPCYPVVGGAASSASRSTNAEPRFS